MGLAVANIHPGNSSTAIWLICWGVFDSYDSVAPEEPNLIPFLQRVAMNPHFHARCLKEKGFFGGVVFFLTPLGSQSSFVYFFLDDRCSTCQQLQIYKLGGERSDSSS